MAMPTFHLAPDLPSVSRLCFGTMTMGEQSGAACSLRLLDAAYDAGVNFFDSAEMYPVPQRSETRGRSEELLGRWLRARRAPRDSVVVATKVAGPSGQMTWIRGGPTSLDSRNIAEAIDGSLHRLGVDYIDLYQIHWPDRYVPMFGETEYDPNRQYTSVPVDEQLEALGRAIDAGKIRYIGLSNETPYGLMKFLQLSKDFQLLPKLLTVQNSYNLLCRNFDSGLAECCHHERISLLAYSPMAMGILSGKYHSSDNCGPPDARMNLFKGRYSEGESRYKLQSSKVKAAVKHHGLWSSGASDKNKSMVEQLQRYGVIRSTKVAEVMEAIDRGLFVPPGASPYHDSPMPIGYNATISAPHMHAACLELLEKNLQPGMRALDVGSGTGYLTACFALMVGPEGRAVGVEHIPELVATSIENIKKSAAAPLLNDGSLSIHVADGREGWPELAPYDAIHVGAAAPQIPEALIQQLKPGGRMVIPVGTVFQELKVVDKKLDGTVGIRDETSVRYVPLTSKESQLHAR